MNNRKARIIALYLPQFHPISENDLWWGKGFTEWHNVVKAKPLFKGHYQPRIPADLGFYDLRIEDVRIEQARLAKEAGIEGFCYWHYYFGNGKQLLERPFNEVLNSGKPDYPFCLGWANHSWTNRSWHVGKKYVKEEVLIEQKYPGIEDNINHFYILLNAFQDRRYIKVDEKPLFLIYNPLDIPDCSQFISLWQNLAVKEGLKGIHFVGITTTMSSLKKEMINSSVRKRLSSKNDSSVIYIKQILDLGFDAVNTRSQTRAEIFVRGIFLKNIYRILNSNFKLNIVDKYQYRDLINYLIVNEDNFEEVYPTIIPNWDRSPRSGSKALIWHGSTPELFKKHVLQVLDVVKDKTEEHRIIFLKSWNEWGEGNYIEPDEKHGMSYLNVLRECALND